MSLAYGIIAIISLSMVGVCVLVDKKRDEWLIWLFVSVELCNLGYFMVSVSKELDATLNSNRIAYLGSVFLPFFLLKMVQRFCKIKRNKITMAFLIAFGVIMNVFSRNSDISLFRNSKCFAVMKTILRNSFRRQRCNEVPGICLANSLSKQGFDSGKH